MYKQPVSRRKNCFYFDSVQIIGIERAACSILMTIGKCDPPFLNTANCFKYTWNSVAMVMFSGSELEGIFTNEGNTVVMHHNNLTGSHR